MSAFLRTTSHTLKSVRCFSASAARKDLNRVTLVGRVGADPTIKEFGNDRQVVNYTVATSETRPDKEGNLIKRTQWHRVSYFPKSDWFSKIKKGDLVLVEGQLRYDDYTDKEGIARTKAEIYQTSFKLLTPRGDREEQE